METSTPLKNLDLRRKSHLKTTANVSPLRRSVVPNGTLNSTLLEVSNDDNERTDRRNQLEIQRKLSNLPQGRASLNESFIKEQFVICTHLYTENKITTKNAWKLQIIELLRPLCQKPNEDSLRVASTSIDISAKVYAIRVDDVHSDGLKLANSMARVTEQVVHPDCENEDASDDEKEQTTNKRRTKKKKRTNASGMKNTVADSSKANTSSWTKLEPVDFTIRVNADTGTIDNLFTNVLKEGSNSFVLLDIAKPLDEHDPIVGNKENVSVLGNLPQLEENIGSINQPFIDFEIDDWDPDQEEKQLRAEKSLLTQTQQVAFDENGIPIPELDGSIHEMFENNGGGDDIHDDLDHNDADEDDVQFVHVEMEQQLRGEIAKIVDFRSNNDTTHTSEYSYNSVVNARTGKFMDQIWAGPHHWRLKFMHRSTARFSGQKTISTIKEQKRGKKRAPEMIEMDTDVTLDLTVKLVMKKKPPSADINKITLPLLSQSCTKFMANIKELMLKPGMCPIEKKLLTENGLDYEVSPYKYENPNDSMYCSQPHENGDDDNDSNQDFDDHFSEEHVVQEQQANLAENLVDNPEMVPKSYVSYALKAKQMDMKKLKSAVWQLLTNTTLNVHSKDTQSKTSKVVPTTFSKLFMDLPSFLQEKEKSELSCPLAFFALLHLCNEENLYLKQMPCYKDFHIRGPQ